MEKIGNLIPKELFIKLAFSNQRVLNKCFLTGKLLFFLLKVLAS
jgi:hypothetical protein